MDDLVFVTEKRRDGKTNLIKNPGAENSGSWTGSGDKSYWTNSNAGYKTYSDNPAAYGYCAFEGAKWFFFQCAGNLRQTITVSLWKKVGKHQIMVYQYKKKIMRVRKHPLFLFDFF